MSDSENKIAESVIYKLTNKNNYRLEINDSSILVQLSYVKIVHYYIIHYFEKMNNKNKNIFIQGFKSITHIFLLLFLYTKHLEMTIFHCQNAIFYFIEYIGQITDKDDNMFFNLTLKDAIVYIYTKTIYDINADIKQNHSTNLKEKQILENIECFISYYKNIINIMVNEDYFLNLTLEDKKEKLTVLRNKMENFIIYFFKDENICKSLNMKFKKILLECENNLDSKNENNVSTYNLILESLLCESK